MEDSPATTPPEPATAQPSPTGAAAGADTQEPPSFAARGRIRRRARFLRKARELAYRDLGGLVFSLHRFGQRNDELVLAKLVTLGNIDGELRALESSLQEHQPVTVLREAGLTACPRCAAIHSSEDRFCPSCGLPMSRKVDLPIAGPAAAAGAAAASPLAPAPAPQRTDSDPWRAGAASPAASPPPGTPMPIPASPAPSATGAGRAPSRPATETAAAGAPGGAEPASATRASDDQPTEVVRPPSGGA